MGASKFYVLLIVVQIIYAISAQEVVKRGPQGFLGMRGKKYVDSEEREFYKRKPQFFVGVKGKKNSDELELDRSYKRAPMGFMGMRGKKAYYPEDYLYPDTFEYVPKRGALIGQIEYTADRFNQNQPEFPLLNELLTDYLQKLERSDEEQEPDLPENPGEHVTNEIEKRAANMRQFYGVRGKKSVQNKRPYDLSFRGKFIGVRGKKDVKDSGAKEIKFLLDHNAPWAKRKGQMGFFGMRGKKWTDETSSEDEMPN